MLSSALLSACTQPAKEPPPEVQAPPPEPAKPAPVPILRPEWSFSSKGDECTAAATAGATALRINVRRESAIRLTVTLARQYDHEDVVPLRFVGPAGTWQVTARAYGASQLGVTLGSDNTALSHILVLLSGGMFSVGLPPHAVVSLAIKPSDTNGQNWFDCAREKLM
jgi:hypothetical protein